MPVQTTHRFNVTDYYRMAETGVLSPDARVELIEGEIIDMSPIGSFHGSVVARLIRILGKSANDRWLIWAQTSVRLDEHSEPEPDIALVRPSHDDYASRHPGPGDIFLIAEVSDSSLNFDRGAKLALYGRAGINEVWIVNLVESAVEVYREPNFTGYGSKTILRAGGKASVLAFPDVTVDVADLLKR